MLALQPSPPRQLPSIQGVIHTVSRSNDSFSHASCYRAEWKMQMLWLGLLGLQRQVPTEWPAHLRGLLCMDLRCSVAAHGGFNTSSMALCWPLPSTYVLMFQRSQLLPRNLLRCALGDPCGKPFVLKWDYYTAGTNILKMVTRRCSAGFPAKSQGYLDVVKHSYLYREIV